MARVLALWEWRLDHLRRTEDDQEEKEGLLWFFLTPHLPPEDLLRLGEPTVALKARQQGVRGLLWPRLHELLRVDTATVLRMVETAVEAELKGEWPHFDQEELAPLLQAGLESEDDAIRDRTRWIIHELGDRGWTGFGDLLNS